MRIVTYNVHSCRGTDGRLAPERIAEVIAATGAEVACLQELDAHRPRTGGLHQAEAVAKALAMDFHFFPAIRVAAEEYGDAILSRQPLTLVRSEMLPRTISDIEPRGALWVTVATPETPWQVMNTHLGLGRRQRRVQARRLAEWMAEAPGASPAVLCGDLNSRRGSSVHRLFPGDWREVQAGSPKPTFDTRFPCVCLDYIYAGPGVEVVQSEVWKTALSRVASDHYPLVAELHWASEQRSEGPEGSLQQLSPA